MYKHSDKKRRKISNNIENKEKENHLLNVTEDEKSLNNEKIKNIPNEKKNLKKKNNKKRKNTSKPENEVQHKKEEIENNNSKKKMFDRNNSKNKEKKKKDNVNNETNIKIKNKENDKDIRTNENETKYDKKIIKDKEIIKREDKMNNEEKKPKHYLIKSSQDKSLLLNNISSLEENKLYVKNLTEDIKKEDLEIFFSKISGYVDTRIIYDCKGKSKKYAYVEFDNNENVKNFLNTLENSNVENFKKFNIKDVDLFTCISNPQKSLYEENKVFIKFKKCNIENDLDIKEEISKFFSSHSIPVRDIRLLGNSTNKHGYIELENNDDVIKCVETIKLYESENMDFNLNYSIPIIKKKILLDLEKIKLNKEKTKKLKEEKKKEENSCTIVVKNLHYNTRKHKLQSFFEQIGEIENIYLSKKISENNIKRNKGFAYITFKNPNDATSSLILNDSILDGRNILISKFQDNKNKNYSEVKRISDFDKNSYIDRKKNKIYGNENYFYEKKRINLSKDTENIVKETEKRCDHTTSSMTNDDFRKLFLK
ncbi:U4/U6 snRNA-associated-splicing factor, putative [Plasmodium gallinaceum]|uniref:U4/U6 snRNA-associated-splicing factor, putative n=1 Tax=Plasmodium gallinaceum TaxID=5849 RepID=A0A1J1H0E8_PLAGA|nr:U4/U6 snRNA-associated-splicing factor, putative [Plasmodium gallinaceum]CRG96756.1 U4/U6 snRNA-associated-splicing factor, putative [Plasmodium gallinaceum]